ncbi:hypothetical protein CRG98_043669 [Punica granatum]|uniref:Integrase catalytic domain-containing protein n=1 Tax=Punica granatum TaxID=22663 RepID=A0A2I0HWP4_PUNGR|nr:hypothetical protein CRG98_043669 [Punica granatum]
MLTIFQTLGQWKTKDAKLVLYHEYLEKLTENFEDISFTYTPRMTNQFADALATLASMVYADQIKAPPNELRPMTAPWPFSMWGMDVIGPINPKASNGHMFILVAIDYFTIWIEAVTLASVTAKAVACFLRRDVIARYGDWHEMLPYALLAYRTSIRTSTGATPYSLVYGMEAVLPIEVEIPSMRILAEAELEEAEWAK